MKKIVIKTDEQAIEILDQALKKELDENVVVEFDGWPTIDVKEGLHKSADLMLCKM